MTEQTVQTAAAGVSWGGVRHAAFTLDMMIGRTAEALGALLVLAETCILFTGVVSRYVFDSPIMWTDELGTFLFLWLAMFGAVVALRRDGHMRLTTFVNWCSPAWRQLARQTVAELVVIVFVLEIIFPARKYLAVQTSTELITLHVSDGYRVLAILVGAGLIATVALLRMLESSTPRGFLAALAVVGAIRRRAVAGAADADGDGRRQSSCFRGDCGGLRFHRRADRHATSHARHCPTLALMVHVPLVIRGQPSTATASQICCCWQVPMFVFLGLLMEMTGIARVMVNFLMALVGHREGAGCLTCCPARCAAAISGISGSKAADMAASGADPVSGDAAARRASRRIVLTCWRPRARCPETIPPSLVLITIGSVVPGLSIAALFTGGLLPAFVAALALVIVAWWRARTSDAGAGERAPFSLMLRTFVIAVPGLSLPFVIRFTVIKGIATATEVSTVGVVYTALLGLLIYRQFNWRRLYPILVETVSLTGAVMMIIGTATGMAWALTQSGFSLWLVSEMAAVPGGSWGFLAVTIVAFIILGSVLEGLPAIVLFGPLLFPVAKAMNVHEVHYAMVVILAMGIGLFAPPFGVGFYGACAIGRTNPDDSLWRIWPYIGALVVALLIVAAIPWLSTGFL